jgi:hypothetical protein
VDFNHRIARLHNYEIWRQPRNIDFAAIARARNVKTPQAELAKRSEFNKKEQELAIKIRSIAAKITYETLPCKAICTQIVTNWLLTPGLR